MKIYVKKVQECRWGGVEYILFREGEYQRPIAIVGGPELQELADAIRDEMKLPVVPAPKR